MKSSLFIAIGVLLAISLAPSIGRAGQTSTTRNDANAGIIFDPTQDILVACVKDQFLWERLVIDPATIRFEASRYTHLFFVQRLDCQEPPTKVYEYLGTYDGQPMATLLPDSTWLIFTQRDKLIWAAAGHVEKFDDLTRRPEEFKIYAIYPEGIIARIDVLKGFLSHESAPLWWIPMGIGHLDFASKFQLEDGVKTERELVFVRSGDQIAWLYDPYPDNRFDKRPPPPPRLFTFDISNHAVHSVVLSGPPMGRGFVLSGFDGRLAFDGSHIIDVATGQTSDIQSSYAFGFGLLNGIAYAAREAKDSYELLSCRLDHPDQWKVIYRVEKSKLANQSGPGAVRISLDNLFALSGDSVWAWSGTRWIKIPPSN